MRNVQLNLSANADVLWLMAAPVDTEVVESSGLLRPLWQRNENLRGLSVIYILGNQFVEFVWSIITIHQRYDLKHQAWVHPSQAVLSPCSSASV